MSEAQNKEVARRFSAELWGEGNVALADQLLAPDLVDHSLMSPDMSGREGHKQMLAQFRAAFPDLKVTVDDVIAEGSMACVLWHGDGTNSGELMGIPATGKTVHVTGMELLRLENGQIKERWAEFGMFALMMQLGVIPAP